VRGEKEGKNSRCGRNEGGGGEGKGKRGDERLLTDWSSGGGGGGEKIVEKWGKGMPTIEYVRLSGEGGGGDGPLQTRKEVRHPAPSAGPDKGKKREGEKKKKKKLKKKKKGGGKCGNRRLQGKGKKGEGRAFCLGAGREGRKKDPPEKEGGKDSSETPLLLYR